MMVGRPLAALFPGERRAQRSARSGSSSAIFSAGRLVRDVSFSVRAGEIVGLGGLVGSGRTEVARVIFGADRLDSGAIVVDGKPSPKVRSPKRRRAAGIGLVPEDRKQQGVVLDKPHPRQRHDGAAVRPS